MDPPTLLMIMIFLLICLFVAGGIVLLMPLSLQS